MQKRMSIVSLGLESFVESLQKQGVDVTRVDWRPPAGGDPEKVKLLSRLERDEIDEANRRAIRKILESDPVLVDVKPAIEVIPGMQGEMFLHSGPPIIWSRMCGPMRGAMIGAALFEGLADTPDKAEMLLQSREITFEPCHGHSAVGPMAGVISPSMPVFVVKNRTHGNHAYSNINEGLGKVLRFGAYSPEVIERLRWMKEVLASALAEVIKKAGEIDLRNLTARALHMGDECHNRNAAATSLFTRTITPSLIEAGLERSVLNEVARFLTGNDHFFLNLSMASCKAIMDTAMGVENSSIVVAMTRNGTDFGLRVAGTSEEWFTAPAPLVEGLYFPGFKAEDANPDLGDSSITETAGIGAFAMAAAPAIVQFVGGSPQDAINYTQEMYEITIAKNMHYTIPSLNFEGTPTGIEVRKVVEIGLTPVINTGIAHKQPGVGQVGAGVTRAPFECFDKALRRFAEKYGYVK